MRLMTMTVALAALMAGTALGAEVRLPTGQLLTPLGVPGARFSPLTARTGPLPATIADGAASIVASPDGARLAILTSGYNRVNGADGKLVAAQSGQYVFLYDIVAGRARWAHTLTVPNSFSGLAWLPRGDGFVVTGGVDDNVHLFRRVRSGFAEAGAPITLGHAAGIGSAVKPQAAGIAVSADGLRALVANYYNDSVSLIDLVGRRVIVERDLRPGRNDPAKRGIAGGEFPFAIAWDGGARAFVSSPRDREIVVLEVGAASVTIGPRIATKAEPTALLLDPAAHRLYATGDNDDRLAIVDTQRLALVGEPRLSLPGAPLGKGLNPNALALAGTGRLFVTLGGINAVASVSLAGTEARIDGLMPTGWYPSGVVASPRDGRLFVINRKSPAGPNPLGCPPKLATVKAQPSACGSANQYIYQLEKAGLLELPRPTPALLRTATAQVLRNIGLADPTRAAAAATMAQLRSKIRHIVYIVKENRTYDQVLGDLPVGNGDPTLAILGQRLSPNHHKMASEFVTLDNFYDSGEQSSTGWTWTTAARVTDTLEKTAPVNYADRGLAYEAEQVDRNIATLLDKAGRRRVNPAAPDDDDVLPGPALLTAPDGPGDEDGDEKAGSGFLWNAALKAGLTVRNYGFADASVYDTGLPGEVPQVRDPFKEGMVVHVTADRALVGHSDPYFRGFDQKMPDYWREREWEREFAEQERTGVMPNLTMLRLSHDHFGDFDKAIDGVDTVETQMADNDYAVGLVLERIAHSRFKDDTLVFVIEDDAQNGADHVDARRSIAFVVGPYVRQHALVSTHYTTVSMVRTIGAVLGLPALGLNDGLAAPMAEVFDLAQTSWDFTAVASDVLRATRLPIPAARFADGPPPARADRDARYWADAMKGQDFRSEDRLDTAVFNAALWRGLASESQSGPRPATGTDPRAADLRR